MLIMYWIGRAATACVVIAAAALGTGHSALAERRTPSADLDRDGLDDQVEQQLIERFQPTLLVSASDCDGRPATFDTGRTTPVAIGKNGTTYGQAFPVVRQGEAGALVELHFFHLWARDCGQNGHPLDAEHVSTLVWADTVTTPAARWQARYWYAAAHQETVCDASHGARADSISAVDRGASVWISRGKHASFLDARLCQWGCGGDKCKDNAAVTTTAVVNLGEPSAPMPGAAWISAAGWPLAARMGPDFTDAVVTQLERTKLGEIVAVNDALSPFKSLILGTGQVASGLSRSKHETGNAFSRAFRAIGRAFKAAGRALKGG